MPKDDLIIARVKDGKVERFPGQMPAFEFKQSVLASEGQLRSQFDAMRVASEALTALREQRERQFPHHAESPKADGDERALNDDIARQEKAVEDTAVAIVMTLDPLYCALRDALGIDRRKIGADAYNGVPFSSAIYALGNRQRHLHQWKKNQAQPNEDVSTLQALGIDPFGPVATYQFLQRCGFADYNDLEARILSVCDEIAAGSGLEYDVSPSQMSIRVSFRKKR